MSETSERPSFSILLFLLYWVLAFVLTALHELGHAALPLWQGHSVRIDLGGTAGLELPVGNLVLAFGGFTAPWYGHTQWGSNPHDSAILLAGPFVSLVLSAAGLYVFRKIKFGKKFNADSNSNSSSKSDAGSSPHKQVYRIAPALAVFVFWWSLLQAVLTLLPLKYPARLMPGGKTHSDGLLIYEILKSI